MSLKSIIHFQSESPPPREREAESKRVGLNLGLLFLLIAAVLAIAGYIFVSHQQAVARAAAREELSAIADLKLRQITNWREERLSDAHFFSHARFVAQEVREFLAHPESETNRAAVLHWLKLLKGGERYYAVILFDSRLERRLAIPESAGEPLPSLQPLMSQLQQAGKAVMSDLHQDALNQLIHLDLLFPIYADPDQRQGTPLAVILLRLDARQFLFPIVQSWPTLSRTAETLLIRRQGNEVLYLNDLRHRTGAALSLRIPLSSPKLPAAKVLRGETNVLEGIDYRGVPVVASGRMVPGTQWAMVAKRDRAEVYAPVRAQMISVIVVLSILLLASALLVALLWRREVERSLQALNTELEQRVQQRTAALEAKNQSLEKFTSSVSHDLKHPLRGIIGFSELLVATAAAKLAENERELLDKITASAARMNALIEDLLAYSRLELQAVTWSVVDLRGLIEEIVEEYRPEIALRQTEVEVDVTCLPFTTDAAGLSQALRNLVGNAIKFSANACQPMVQIIAHEAEEGCLLEVRDNGIGFDMKFCDKIFEIFQRLHNEQAYPGTGIGLAIVKKAVSRIGGRVWAESEPGKGASFFVQLPKKEAVPIAA